MLDALVLTLQAACFGFLAYGGYLAIRAGIDVRNLPFPEKVEGRVRC